MNILGKTCVRVFRIDQSTRTTSLLVRNTAAYKSALSLENFYPDSSLRLRTPKAPSATETFNGYIPMEELEITYSRSTGPGGQNVNKVNTKVDVRFHLENAKWLSNKDKERLLEKLGPKLTKDGYLIFRSDLTRSQQLNLADCLEKMRQSIRGSLVLEAVPSPETQERIRRRLEHAATERLMNKRQRSQVKNERQAPGVL
ncbi:unnamed protein product [Phaedon cochleariae]|uniref:Large ribosomal subunit protein mL62 n=1 Tax=Phaedon cochleariae TaxID=80249 RepID=A0A9N9S833_PHACE|nr:unnamed protein product [Phaedon cochleariae]